MFDPFAPTRAELQDAFGKQAATLIAMLEILIEHGLVTEKDFNDRVTLAQQRIDQMLARKREEAEAELSPEERQAVQFFRKITGGEA